MRRIMLIALALVAALGITASTATTATTETGVTATSIKIGGTFPLSGPASLYATIPVGDEGVLLVHQRPPRAGRQARRLRPPDRLELQGRPVLAADSGAADARARRAGQRVRGRRLARHRGESRDPART